HENNKQIVNSSDKPPKAFETLEERLRSRFEMGLPVDISSPDYETRMAILRKKEEMEGYNIDTEIIQYIAANIKSNIRELEGALTKITAYAKLYKTDITLEVAENALRDLISPNESDDIEPEDRKSTRLNSSHVSISYAVFCLIKKKSTTLQPTSLNRT